MKCFLIGSRGRLGKAIASEYANEGIVLLKRSVYESWSGNSGSDKVSKYFEKISTEDSIIFVASGLLDPRLPKEDLLKVNYHLPKNLIDGATNLGIKVITFGTAMEGLLQSKNPYVQSKTALGEYVGKVASADRPAIHLQMHTLYGLGEPDPFMFIGQILTAIQNNAIFSMTSGRQLREYHHLNDEAKAIRNIAKIAHPGVINISHGKPVTLRAVAENIFDALGKRELLHVGALPEPLDENYEQVLKPIDILLGIEFRDSLPAIVQYVKGCNSCPEIAVAPKRDMHDKK